MRRFTTIRTLLVLFVLPGALVVGTALPALAQAPTGMLRIGAEATLVAKGAAVRVPIRYRCSPDTVVADLVVEVRQRVGGNRLAVGGGFPSSTLICDGQLHTVVVTVTAQGENAFRRGPALVQAFFQLCNEFECVTLTASREVTVVRR